MDLPTNFHPNDISPPRTPQVVPRSPTEGVSLFRPISLNIDAQPVPEATVIHPHHLEVQNLGQLAHHFGQNLTLAPPQHHGLVGALMHFAIEEDGVVPPGAQSPIPRLPPLNQNDDFEVPPIPPAEGPGLNNPNPPVLNHLFHPYFD